MYTWHLVFMDSDVYLRGFSSFNHLHLLAIIYFLSLAVLLESSVSCFILVYFSWVGCLQCIRYLFIFIYLSGRTCPIFMMIPICLGNLFSLPPHCRIAWFWLVHTIVYLCLVHVLFSLALDSAWGKSLVLSLIHFWVFVFVLCIYQSFCLFVCMCMCMWVHMCMYLYIYIYVCMFL